METDYASLRISYLSQLGRLKAECENHQGYPTEALDQAFAVAEYVSSHLTPEDLAGALLSLASKEKLI